MIKNKEKGGSKTAMKKEYEKPVVIEVSFQLNEGLAAEGSMTIEPWSQGNGTDKSDYQFPIVS